MAQQFTSQNIKKRTAVLVFLFFLTAPLVLYVEAPQDLYNEVINLMKSPTAVMIEKETAGPLKKVCFISNQVAAVALQEEQYIQ